jgi:serine/threonine-protein kinase
MEKCSTCGSALENGSCSHCGQSVEAFATRTVASSTSRSPAAALASDGSRFVPGALISERYRIVALLGRGGMGEVYRADDLTLGQQVALKFLPASLAHDEDALRRFRNEVRIARQVSHPNVCRVYDVGEIAGHFFLSMEYVDGEDLGSLLRRIGRLPADKAVEVSRKLCAGLAAAHERGVLHRDLKPGNVMLDGRGQVLLTDFGLAGLSDEIRGAEIRSGTPAYMAPEQLEGKEVSVRSDIYGLGLVLYELFTGKRAFEAATLQELIRMRNETAPASISAIVHELDPTIERVILRCLDPDPSQRPGSALAVAAALPGGDPLAAALAAGETPSPQMVAAAGEGTGLAPRMAIPVAIVVLIGLLISQGMAIRTSALERIHPEYPPEVLTQKARDLIAKLGYNLHPADTNVEFEWDYSLVSYIEEHNKPVPPWNQILSGSPSLLRFSYRQSNYPLFAGEFHDDKLTPGMVDQSDPPPIMSGMVSMQLDSSGQLIDFEAVPPQLEQPGSPTAEPDWAPLFAAANLDPKTLQANPPQWTWLATSDTRQAWTGVWPGSKLPLRVEAAALHGQPVGFSLIGPWQLPDRMPPVNQVTSADDIRTLFYGVLAVLICIGAALLARYNLASGRGDRSGAFRLAVFFFTLHMLMWLTRSHLPVTFTIVGMFLLAVCTSSFYGLLMWTVYLALEPFARRYWPKALVSWTRLWSGRFHDPIVGRDALFGAGFAVFWSLLGRISDLVDHPNQVPPTWTSSDLLLGFRGTLGAWLTRGPHGIREALLFFFILFLLRVLLRNQWLAAAAFAIIFTAAGPTTGWQAIWNLIVFGLLAVLVLRFGLLALAASIITAGLLGAPPSLQTSAWYFGNLALLTLSAVALIAWAFYTSIGGRRAWFSALAPDRIIR